MVKIRLFFIQILLIITLLSTFSCKKETVQQTESTLYSCAPDSPTVKEVADITGYLWYNNDQQKYAIYIGISGTYDSQIVAVLCEVPEKFKKEGIQVLFSGKYRQFGKQPENSLPGQIYYYLQLTNIKEKSN
jgi:hypothetical protein